MESFVTTAHGMDRCVLCGTRKMYHARQDHEFVWEKDHPPTNRNVRFWISARIKGVRQDIADLQRDPVRYAASIKTLSEVVADLEKNLASVPDDDKPFNKEKHLLINKRGGDDAS